MPSCTPSATRRSPSSPAAGAKRATSPAPSKRLRLDAETLPSDTHPTLTYIPHIHRLPPELHGEIASHLLPLDLVRFSHTSDAIRVALSDPIYAGFVWSAALSTIDGLPPCPPDLPPSQYLKLVLLPECQECTEPCDSDQIDWDLRVRLCERCLKEHITTFNECTPPSFPKHPEIKVLHVLYFRPPTPLGCAVLTSEFNLISEKLANLSDPEKVEFIKVRRELLVSAHSHARECKFLSRAVVFPSAVARVGGPACSRVGRQVRFPCSRGSLSRSDRQRVSVSEPDWNHSCPTYTQRKRSAN
ncbi:hypothetical protein FB451DRAFT_1252365 [Mycena latifolia]|nr:hypothetical protein FB451DRAFT_1252365 [Mycena latifolia]